MPPLVVSSLSVFATVQEAAARIPDRVRWLQTLGFHSPGDGGGAFFSLVPRQAAHAGRVRTADGRHWEIVGNALNVRQFGARGDGTTDDTKSLQSALDCPAALSLFFPAGSYRAIGLALHRSCALSGEGAELVWDEPFPHRDLLRVKAGNFSASKLRFRGRKYETLETAVAPASLLRISAEGDDPEVENVRILDCDFVGGMIGCNIGIAADVLIERMRAEHCRDFGLTLQRGPRSIVVRGLVARNIGTYGGIKTAMNGTKRATERLVISDFVISDCGWLSPDPTTGQEGIDLACGFAREWVIANGVISHCGGGGIELKVGDIISGQDEVYEDIVISNVVIHVTGNQGAIKLNWNGPRSTASGKHGRRVLITGNILRHEGADRRPGAGVVLMAWSDVTITNNRIEGAKTGILLQARGGPNDTSYRIHIGGNVIHDVVNGIEACAGTLDGIRITGNDIRAAMKGIHFDGAAIVDIEIDRNTILQSGQTDGKVIPSGISLFQARGAIAQTEGMTIQGNQVTARGGHALEIAGSRVSGLIFQNILTAPAAPVKIADGAWELFGNHLSNAGGGPGLLITGDATAREENNIAGRAPAAGRGPVATSSLPRDGALPQDGPLPQDGAPPQDGALPRELAAD